MRIEYVEAVLAVVGLVAPGTAVAYGDVAELLGSGGPRQIGSVMSRYGSGVPWWRILKASGQPPEGHGTRALGHYLAEGTPLLTDHVGCLGAAEGRWRVDLSAARWSPGEDDFDQIDAIAAQLARRRHPLSVADDGMSV